MPLSREEILERLADGTRSLAGLDLSGVDLSRMDLRGVDLSRADLSTADLRWAVLEGADLSASVLRQADLRWAVLRGANLSQADLRRANLAWTDLEGADLLGADLDNAILDNAHLGEDAGRRRSRSPRPARVGAATTAAGAGRFSSTTLRELSPAVLVLLSLGALLVVLGWGWLYRHFYFDTFFQSGNVTSPPDLVRYFDLATLLSGAVDVVLRTVLAAVALPVLLLAIGLVLLAFLALPLGLIYLGERMLGDVIRPAWRPVVVLGLFLAYFAVFIMAFPMAAFASNWVGTTGLPKGPVLGDLLGLWQVGGWVARLGLLAVAGIVGYLVWLGWRLLSRWLHSYEVPTRWRLRYPALNDALMRARSSRLFGRDEPLTETERRRGLAALAVGALLLATLMTGVGMVRAYSDMCDGGHLPRVQLYVDRSPAVPDEEVCQRLLVTTDGNYYVFFPNQTTQQVPTSIDTRVVNLKVVPTEGISIMEASGGTNVCATCLNEAGRISGNEWVVYDPNLVQTAGTVTDATLPTFSLQPTDPTMPGTVQLAPNTVVTVNGLPASAQSIQPGRQVVARGKLAGDGTTLSAVAVDVVEGAPAPVGTPGAGTPVPGSPVGNATLNVDLSNPLIPVFNGAGWKPGDQVALGLGRPTDTTVRLPLPGGAVVIGEDGTFSVPIQFSPQMPTGPDYISIAQDPVSGQYATSNWLLAPPATPTPIPTPPPQETQELPTSPPATATPAASNTPLPTKGPGGYVKPTDCNPDEFEYDNTRPFQKEIYVVPGDAGKAVGHNFCPRGDVDLSWFYVKTGRYYRVETKNLAAGVDTVMAVGDLSNSTPCQPAGCWNDDAAALTFASRIEFQAIQDAKALITVSNRGGNYGTNATYELSVVEFVPTPVPTPTLGPTATNTGTPTVTPTPKPLVDTCDLVDPSRDNDRCSRACPGKPVVNIPYPGVLRSATDLDWFMPLQLAAGTWNLTLQPPEDEDYDLIVHNVVNAQNDNCPANPDWIRVDAGDGEPEKLSITLDKVTQIAIEVRSFSGDFNPHAYYYLLLSGGPPPPVGTPSPTSTATDTEVPTSTSTPTPPILPPGFVTDTPTPTAVSAALLRARGRP